MDVNEAPPHQKQIFSFLDPIIQQILRCHEDLNTILSTSQHKSISHLLSIHKKQVELFHGLRSALIKLSDGGSISRHGGTDDMRGHDGGVLNHLQPAFATMERYITLPIILCFQQSNHIIIEQRQPGTSLYYSEAERNKFDVIYCSALLAVLESAASCLEVFVRSASSAKEKVIIPHEESSSLCSISVEIRLRCTVTVSTALTLVLESVRSPSPIVENVETDSIDKDSSRRRNSRSQLDKGDACFQSLLGALYYLLSTSFYETSTSSVILQKQNSFIKEMYLYVPNGGLIFGIIQNCLNCLNHQSSQTNSTSSEKKQQHIYANDMNLDEILRGNVQLQLTSLNVLEALMKTSLIQDSTRKSSEAKEDLIVGCFQQAFPTLFGVRSRLIALISLLSNVNLSYLLHTSLGSISTYTSSFEIFNFAVIIKISYTLYFHPNGASN